MTNAPADITEIYERIRKGSMPGLVSGKFSDRDVFYSSYLQTYIDRDVKEQVQLADPLLFSDFVGAAACRAGQMLNVHDIAQDVGVSNDTAKRWLQVLEKSDVIFFRRPYSNNLLSYSDGWFDDTSLEELKSEREKVQADYSNPELDVDYREYLWDLLHKFDEAIDKKEWEAKNQKDPHIVNTDDICPMTMINTNHLKNILNFSAQTYNE